MNPSITLVLLLILACSNDQPQDARHPDEGLILETSDLPDVIAIEELVPLGFDTTTMYEIEPHFAMLNTALITLAELKRSYDAAVDQEHRARLNAYAIPFHISADRHQRAILKSLQPPLDTLFDRYIETRKREAGLADWHLDHSDIPEPTELPGLVEPIPRRH